MMRSAWERLRAAIDALFGPDPQKECAGSVAPRAAATDDSIDARAVGLRDAALSGWYNLADDELFEGFRITKDDIVLDAGCGDGIHSYLSAMRGAHVIFSDIDAAKVEATRQRVATTPARGITAVVSDANPLPLDDGIASRIISTEVIEHVDDPVRFLAELARVGRSGALYLLAVPDPVGEGLQKELAPAAFFQKAAPGCSTIRGLSSGHLRVFGREEFERLVTDAGLVIEQHRYYGFYWSIWLALFWTCNVDYADAKHPVLDNWARTWKALIETPGGIEVKRTLDSFLPKSQVILASKP